MITVRRAQERVSRSHDGQNPSRMVDFVGPGATNGFHGLAYLDEQSLHSGHPVSHRPDDASEVLLYVRDGTVTLQDGSTAITLPAGSVLRAAAGRSADIDARNTPPHSTAHLFRIGLMPSALSLHMDLTWTWFSIASRQQTLRAVASWDGRSGALRLSHNAVVYSAVLRSGRHVMHPIGHDRGVWIHVIAGKGRLGGLELSTGDGAGLVHEPVISFTPSEETEVLVIDLPRLPDERP
ncbi:MAG: redox-sensitive bicupin YhaK (pirin superfamily) [Myxococcota bacterium]|jgi:redox-sensitive bicupin YhaK (pirin superfamily)